ncbi:MAG: M13 family metallopeptidase [Muribaculaceae bacterium]|nr:M13 family metallopeptidase [Muribaculaceae bacterium]MBQ5509228.1 M13 family metallopeptidase [Muribaculaceae bacterium]
MVAKSEKHGLSRADMDLTVNPGDDFYRYAGGGWMKANPLTAEYSSYGVFHELAEKNRDQLKELFDNLANEHHAKGSNGQKVTDLYAMAMDSVRLNREGTAPIMKDLNDLKNFNRAQLTEFIAYQHMHLGNPFFGIGVEADLANSAVNTMYMSAGSMSLPDRDYYLKTDAESKKIQQKYRDYLTKMFMLAGYKKKDAQRATKTIYNIEYKFAEASMTRAEQRDIAKLYNLRTIDQLQADYPAIDWKKYFNLMGISNMKQLILEQPKVMAVANELMTNLKDQEIKDYVAGGIITSAAGYLSDEVAETRFDFYGRTLSGQQERQARWKRAMGVPSGVVGEAVGQLYVEKYFAGDSKEKMVKLIGDLRKALAERIANLDWMSDQTKVNALVKLNSFTVKVGYPDKWKDYSKLNIDPSLTLYDNMKAASLWATKRNLEKYGKPVDREEWGMTPQTVNAYYNPQNNEIVFPAAILQAPFFDPKADDATNYGAIGVVIGHEMTHGFDDQGRTFDYQGNYTDWWTAEDAEKFNTAAEKLALQFDAIDLGNGEHANGHLTLGENIADQGGLRIAYDAFMKTTQAQEGKKIDGFTPVQRFYLSYGRIWAENITPEAAYQQTKSDPHSLGEYRVNQTLRNIDTFFKAFDIKPGAKMWLDEKDRTIIW